LGLPITVHRPSIIVGHSKTGKASSFKVLYWPLRLYARGRWRTMFGRPHCTVDVVPVDFVADAIAQLLSVPAACGSTLHLAAGAQRQSTIGELAMLAERFFQAGKIRYFDPELYRRCVRPFVLPALRIFRPDVARGGGVFLPYFIRNPSFETDQTTALLANFGIAPPKVAEYFETIMQYAKDTDFGRRA
jgi:long-chain acyl-CoA synthetase